MNLLLFIQAAVTGNVIIGKDCYIGPEARPAKTAIGGQIIIEDGCNVQSYAIHMFPGVMDLYYNKVHILAMAL